MAIGFDFAAIILAVSRAAGTNFSGSKIFEASPQETASSAPINYPVKTISIALDFPIALVSLYDPPIPGIVPKLISGCPNFAFAPA